MKVDLVESWGSDLTPVNAARVSFANESEWEYWDEDGRGPSKSPSHCGEFFNIAKLSTKDTKLIHYLAKHKHTSCFEHQGATCRLKVPIFIARQIQRHRTFSYNEISRRYVDNAPEFFFPDKWRKKADNVKQGSSDEAMDCPEFDIAGLKFSFEEVCILMAEYYEGMMERGLAPELARMILPQNLYTEFHMSGNLRAWSHFLQLRLDGHAQLEVQHVAQQVQELLQPVWPVSMQALMEN